MCILDYSYNSYLWHDESKYIYPVDVDIWKYAEDDETRLNIGTGRCFYLDVERSINDSDASPDELLDVYSGSAAYIGHIYESNSYNFNEKVQELFPDALFNYNLLIVDRLEILPNYRGCGLSVKIFQELVARLGKGAGIAALKPFPLQFENADSERDPSERYIELDLRSFIGNVEYEV